jgi:hypothetical protein
MFCRCVKQLFSRRKIWGDRRARVTAIAALTTIGTGGASGVHNWFFYASSAGLSAFRRDTDPQ